MANRILNWTEKPFGEGRYDLRTADVPEVFGVTAWDRGIRSIGRGETDVWGMSENPVQRLRAETEGQYAQKTRAKPMVFLCPSSGILGQMAA